ncbi:DNA translocase FtsK [Desulfosporosinus sp. BG]|uniref:DNA translocase FtsK n=1 Tax=Desulfosporosinus sp. BG TaxID=1633135 RepID=UPI000839EEE0|nr:DNA translocase FtsK [Desulfosporosinus sp. BG]ODA42843.1 Cell division protein FtsK [Desulfosporosinus sp. BG]
MSKRENGSNSFWFKLVSVFLMLLSLTGQLGAFGFSMGKPFYFLFKVTMGSLAWAGPFLCFVLAILLWIYSSILMSFMFVKSDTPSTRSSAKVPRLRKRRKTQSAQQSSSQSQKSDFKQDIDSKGISLPAGKLVSLKGFNQYFASPEWVDMKDSDLQKAEELREIGRDFPSYFGTGESVFPKSISKMTSLQGLNKYFEEVDQEERLEQAIPRQDNLKPTEMPGIHTTEAAQFSSVFKSQTDQQEYLAQFKTDGNPLDQKTLDFVATLKESSRTIDEAEKLAQVFESSVSKTGFEEKIKSILIQEIMAEIKTEGRSEVSLEVVSETNSEEKLVNEPSIEFDLEDELVETESTSLEMLEFEAPAAAAAELKPNYAGQVAQLVDPMKDQHEGEGKPQVVSHVENCLADGQSQQVASTVENDEDWKPPDFNLLDPVVQRVIVQDPDTPIQLEKVLLDFGVKAKVIRVARGPVITRYELAPAPGVKISKIVNLADDIALGLAARDVRIEAPIPGKAAIGIEVPNKQPRSVPFREVLETSSFGQYPSKLKIGLGKDIADQPIIADLIKMPHLLVAGATGSGKSVCITTIINSILFNATPDEVKFLLVDPKMVELSQYNGIPHLLAPVVVDPKKAASALKWIVKEMENRYELFAAAGVRDVERYNKMKAGDTVNCKPTLPLIVVIIDELADLMMVAAGEVEEAICRLAQMARAAGIHLVIATQRPSVDVITGVIKANIPSRISFAVSSQIDSRTILDATGAEKLLGRGDMLYSPLGVNKALRVQGCLVTDDEVQRIIMHWKGLGRPDYLDPERLFAETALKNEEGNGPDDALFIDAGQLIIRTNMASVSFLQRRLKLGYARAARLMDMLEENGVVGAYEGSKPRHVLLTLEEFNERFG